jgi:hypothetical protein
VGEKNCTMTNKNTPSAQTRSYIFHEPVIVLHLHKQNKETSETKNISVVTML